MNKIKLFPLPENASPLDKQLRLRYEEQEQEKEQKLKKEIYEWNRLWELRFERNKLFGPNIENIELLYYKVNELNNKLKNRKVHSMKEYYDTVDYKDCIFDKILRYYDARNTFIHKTNNHIKELYNDIQNTKFSYCEFKQKYKDIVKTIPLNYVIPIGIAKLYKNKYDVLHLCYEESILDEEYFTGYESDEQFIEVNLDMLLEETTPNFISSAYNKLLYLYNINKHFDYYLFVLLRSIEYNMRITLDFEDEHYNFIIKTLFGKNYDSTKKLFKRMSDVENDKKEIVNSFIDSLFRLDDKELEEIHNYKFSYIIDTLLHNNIYTDKLKKYISDKYIGE